jgi:hypothetical protein
MFLLSSHSLCSAEHHTVKGVPKTLNAIVNCNTMQSIALCIFSLPHLTNIVQQLPCASMCAMRAMHVQHDLLMHYARQENTRAYGRRIEKEM